MAVLGAVLLLAVNGNLGAVHIQHHALWRIQGLYLANEFAVDAGQPTEILFLGQHFGLEGLQARGQRRPTFPELLRTDQPEGRILCQPLRIVDIFVASDSALDGLAQQVRQGKLGVLPAP